MTNKFLQLDDDLFVMPEKVCAVKRSGLQEDTCIVFLKGQSALGGFVVNQSADEVISEIEDALAAEEEEAIQK